MAQRNRERQLTVRDILGRRVRFSFYNRRDIQQPEEADMYVETAEEEFARRHRRCPIFDRDHIHTGVIRGQDHIWAYFTSDDGSWTFPIRVEEALSYRGFSRPGFDGRPNGSWTIELLEGS